MRWERLVWKGGEKEGKMNFGREGKRDKRRKKS